MHMYFYADAESVILFSTWVTSTWQGLLGSCFGVLAMALAYEGLKALRCWLLEVSTSKRPSSAVGSHDSATSLTDDHLAITVTPPSRWTCNWSRQKVSIAFHCLQAFLHLLQVTLGYMLMLIAMTFNAYLFLSVVVGASLGYLIFNYKRPIIIDANEQCH